MAELKTKLTKASVDGFLKGVDDEGRRKDCQALVRLMKRAVKAEPRMWGSSIVGFGDYSYTNASGRENDWFLAGFSPRKAALTLYIYGRFRPLRVADGEARQAQERRVLPPHQAAR